MGPVVFINTSVIVAILSKEPDATEFANRIEVDARSRGHDGDGCALGYWP